MSDDDLSRKAAYGVLRRIEDCLPEEYSLFANGEDVVINALTRHDGHLGQHSINGKTLDPFKLTCWIVGELLEGLEDGEGKRHQAQTIITAALRVLQETLLLETDERVILPDEEERLIVKLVTEEFCGRSEYGVGVNGLFLSFHCACIAFKISQNGH